MNPDLVVAPKKHNSHSTQFPKNISQIAKRTLGRPHSEPNPNILLHRHPSTQPQASKTCHQRRHTIVEAERKQEDRKKVNMNYAQITKLGIQNP